jgi:hypothetical protein
MNHRSFLLVSAGAAIVSSISLAAPGCGGPSDFYAGGNVDPGCGQDPASCPGDIGSLCDVTADCFDGYCCTDKECDHGMCTYLCDTDRDCPDFMLCGAHGNCYFVCDVDADCGPHQKCKEDHTVCEYD